MESVTLKTPGVSCSHCDTAISGAVKKIPGVAMVKVDLAAKNVVVEYDSAVASPAAIREAIENQGYDVA